MTRVDNWIDIKAPKDKIFAYVADLEARPQWVKWSKDTEVTSMQKRGRAPRTAALCAWALRSRTWKGLVTDYQPGYTIARRLTRGMDMNERVSVLTSGDATKVTYSVEYKPPMGKMGGLIDFLFMAKLFDQLMEDSLAILKERMEAR